jgi:hypothetical protein
MLLITKADIPNNATGVISGLSESILFGVMDPTYYLWKIPFYCPYDETLLSLDKAM